MTANPDGETHGVIIPVPVSVMEKAGTYRFVLHFYDDYADSYRNHQVKTILEVNAIICVPEIHNYDGIDFSPSASEAQNRQEKAGYISRAWTDEDPIKAMARVEGKEEPDFKRPTIVFIANHGLPGAIWFKGPYYDPRISEGWKAILYASGRGDDIFYRFSAINNHDFSKVIFIAFVGCYTSQTHADRGNLLEEAIRKNATTALGFKEKIMIGTNTEDDPKTPEREISNIVTNWTKAFWNAILGLSPKSDHPGYDLKPMNILSAVQYAVDTINYKFGNYYNWDKYEILGEINITLIPPKCKD